LSASRAGRRRENGTKNVSIAKTLRLIWTASGFVGGEMSAYAEKVMEAEVRRGVMALGLLSLLLLLGSAALHAMLGLGAQHVYTFLALAGLSLHVAVSTRAARQVRVLYMLAMVLLVVSGTALVLLAHRTGSFGTALFSAIALLFMIVPMVPWGLREALTVTLLIYLVFTASTRSTPLRFASQDLWALQFLMLGAGTISLALVVRSVLVRKKEIEARFGLERSHEQMELLSLQDPLTGSWNRRYLAANFEERRARIRTAGHDCQFVLLDIDRFKPINDTYGHAYGDRLLQCVAKAYAGVLQADEMLVRMGGDEFALLLHGTDAQFRLWQASGALQAYGRELGAAAAARPTVSVGFVQLPRGRATALDEAYALADQALYAAKRAGGNRIVDAASTIPAAPAQPVRDTVT
jgi:diguanylate cyclase